MQSRKKTGMQFAIALEGFMTTEPEILLQILEILCDVWKASKENKVSAALQEN